ncbi:MAG: hypothetical protein ABI399_08240 [Bauldia sp.]
MRALAVAAFCLAATMLSARGAETLAYPTSDVFQNTKANDALYVECEPPAGTALICRFTSMVVTKKDPAGLQAFPKSECDSLEAFASAWRDGVPPAGLDAEAFRDRFAHRDPQQQADINALIEAFAAVCKRGDTASEDQLLDVMRRKEGRTCALSVNTYELHFNWDAASGRWDAESQEPSEPCSPMRVAAFERPAGSPGNASWSYRIADIAGKPGDNASCTQPDAPSILYWPEPDEMYVACDYLRITD